MQNFAVVVSALIVAFTGLACSSAVAPGPEEISTTSARVESRYRWTQFEYQFTPDEASVSTAVIFVPHLDASGAPVTANGVQVRYTCGVTFVSAHYAITAAHCIPAGDVPDPASATFTVKSYDISGVSWEKLVATQQLSGWFPNFSHVTLNEADGYRESTLNQCHIIHRCSNQYGLYNCDLDADVALIKCDDRSPFGPHMDVATTDDLQGPVEVRWAHEVLDVATAAPIPPAPGNPLADAIYEKLLDRWDHYVTRDELHPEANYHYFATNQLFPLVSSPWYLGDLVYPRTRVPQDPVFPDTTLVWTDLFGCHGTSGAGVTQIGASGRHELLGPVAATGEGWGEGSVDRLCENLTPDLRGHRLMAYTSLGYTRWLYTTVLNDPNEFWLFGKPQR